MDEKDKKIIEILKEDSSLSTREIAKKIHIPITTVHKRIKKLKENRVIKRFTIELDYKQLGRNLAAYVLVSADLKQLKEKNRTQYDIVKDLKKIEAVEKADIVTGGTDVVVSLRVKDVEELNKVLLSRVQKIEGISDTQTLVVIEEG